MKKWVFIGLIFVLLISMITACTILSDREKELGAYSDDIMPAISEALADFDAWKENSGDQQKLDLLQKHANNINAINSRYFDGPHPQELEWSLKQWEGPEEDNLKDWKKEMRELAYAAWYMRERSTQFADKLEEISEAQGKLSKEELKQVEEIARETSKAGKSLHWEYKTWKGDFRPPWRFK